MASKTTDQNKAELEAYFERMNNRQAPSWRPEPNTTFKGEVIGLRMGGSEPPVGYGVYPVLIYKDLADNSTKAVHAFHQVLRNSLAELNTDIGSVQYVTYNGTREHNTAKQANGEPVVYHLYDVENFGTEVAAKEEGFTF